MITDAITGNIVFRLAGGGVREGQFSSSSYSFATSSTSINITLRTIPDSPPASSSSRHSSCWGYSLVIFASGSIYQSTSATLNLSQLSQEIDCANMSCMKIVDSTVDVSVAASCDDAVITAEMAGSDFGIIQPDSWNKMFAEASIVHPSDDDHIAHCCYPLLLGLNTVVGIAVRKPSSPSDKIDSRTRSVHEFFSCFKSTNSELSLVEELLLAHTAIEIRKGVLEVAHAFELYLTIQRSVKQSDGFLSNLYLTLVSENKGLC